LRKNLFEVPYAYTLLACATGSPSGISGTPGIYLVDLYADTEYGGYGVKKALFAEMGRTAEEKIDWFVVNVTSHVMIRNVYILTLL